MTYVRILILEYYCLTIKDYYCYQYADNSARDITLQLRELSNIMQYTICIVLNQPLDYDIFVEQESL